MRFPRVFSGLVLLIVVSLGAKPALTQPAGVAGRTGGAATGIPSEAPLCFAIRELPEEERAIAGRWLLDVLDKEGLYTIASALKPVTLALIAGRISVESPTPDELGEFQRAVRILAKWQCGDLAASVLAGTVVIDGRRVLHGVVYRRSLVRKTVAAHRELFGAAGIVEALPAEQVLATVELTPPPLRHRLWGHLLGYPAYAVDFFADADAQQRNAGAPSGPGPLVPRDFFSVPTFARETNHFVWAVPKGHQPNADDVAIRDAAAPVLARYRELRERFIGEGKPGVVALLHAWLCTETGCAVPEHVAVR